MATDWTLIRRLVNSALDACEAIDRLEIKDEERCAPLRTVDGQEAGSVWDLLQSAYIAPENARYTIIRGRGQLGCAAPFVQPVSRVLQQVGSLAGELVGAQQLQTPVAGLEPYAPENEQSMEAVIESLARWYENHLVTTIEDAVSRSRDGTLSSSTSLPNE